MDNENISPVDIDLLKVSYEAARTEINTRIRVRSQIIGFYLAATFMLISFILTSKLYWEVSIAISFTSLGTSFMLVHQNICIGLANNFCQQEIKPQFSVTPMWGNCYASQDQAHLRRIYRFTSQLLLILLPPSFAFIIANLKTGIWVDKYSIISMLAAAAAFSSLVLSKTIRKKYYENTD